ncbi:50S ribosomal protein L4, partial [archaeon]|nr:50S ribosomal protein L4 [archaeon]
MKASVIGLDGKKMKDIELPKVFNSEYRPDLIKRAVLSIESMAFQPKGNYLLAGRDNTAHYVGMRRLPQMRRLINVGRARKPRLKNRRELLYGQVAGIPGTVSGPEAHPPKVEKILGERINRKEKRLATDSAIAATALRSVVEGRGNELPEGLQLPIVLEEKIEGIGKTKEILSVLKALNLLVEVEKAKAKKKVRGGKGKKRGRKYKRKKSLLFIVNDSSKLLNAAGNLEGVDVVRVESLNARLLAPGCRAGR